MARVITSIYKEGPGLTVSDMRRELASALSKMDGAQEIEFFELKLRTKSIPQTTPNFPKGD